MSFPNWKEVERASKMKSSSNFSYSCLQMFFPSVMCLQLTPNKTSPASAALQCLFSAGKSSTLPIPDPGEFPLLTFPSCPYRASLHHGAPQSCTSCLPVCSIISSFVWLPSALSVHPQVKVLLLQLFHHHRIHFPALPAAPGVTVPAQIR